jgi:hypothetical protein
MAGVPAGFGHHGGSTCPHRHRRRFAGAAFAPGLNPQLAIVSDDAGQFNVLCLALCWIHAERVLAKLVGFNDAQRADLERVRTLM